MEEQQKQKINRVEADSRTHDFNLKQPFAKRNQVMEKGPMQSFEHTNISRVEVASSSGRQGASNNNAIKCFKCLGFGHIASE